MALHARVALKPHLDRLYEAAAEIIVSKHSDLNFQLLRTQPWLLDMRGEPGA